MMRFWFMLFAGVLTLAAGAPRISTWQPGTNLAWSNATTPGVVTLETAAAPNGAWTPLENDFSTNTIGGTTLPGP